MDLLKSFIDAGFESDLFDSEQRSLHKCIKVIEYINSHGTFPKITDQSSEVRTLANWLTSIRGAKSNNSKRILYPSLIKLANDNGYPNLFNITKSRGEMKKRMTSAELYSFRESKSIKIWYELNKFIELYNKYPSKIYKNRKHIYDDEFYNKSNKLFNWLSSMRRSSTQESSRVLYPALNELITKSKYPNILTKNWKDDLL